jgi:hypothetical protein
MPGKRSIVPAIQKKFANFTAGGTERQRMRLGKPGTEINIRRKQPARYAAC